MIRSLRTRWEATGTPNAANTSDGMDGLGSSLRLRSGTRRDYDALAEHHYRAGKPATATRVLVYETAGVSLAARFRGMKARPHQDEGEVVAVLVESLPSLSCRMRDAALGGRYGSHLAPEERAVLLNAEVRCISRVVVDPRWRGLGLATRLVREALDTATTPVTEALAAMGRVHPFFERAGMTAYPRPVHDFDLRLLDALRAVGITDEALYDPESVWRTIETLPGARSDWVRRELNRWYRKNAGRGIVDEPAPEEQLKAARERIGLQPVYYAWVQGSA